LERYYFHAEQDGERTLDKEGSHLSDWHNAQAHAVRAAADLAAEDLKRGRRRVEHIILVENQTGLDIIRVRVSALLEVQAIRTA
jgi:hypothetical protein